MAVGKIQHYGIQHNYLQYRAPVIKRLAGVKSPYLEMGGKWPIRVDPSDITQVYFHDPNARPPKPSWHVIPWIHALKGVEPFTDTGCALSGRAVTSTRGSSRIRRSAAPCRSCR